jgi:hypothetical protein
MIGAKTLIIQTNLFMIYFNLDAKGTNIFNTKITLQKKSFQLNLRHLRAKKATRCKVQGARCKV